MLKDLVYPIDTLTRDSLVQIVATIAPENNIETNYKEAFELAHLSVVSELRPN